MKIKHLAIERAQAHPIPEEFLRRAPKLAWVREAFTKPKIDNHYQLLAYFSMQINNGLLLDLGTNAGLSALAMAVNPTNTVVTVDVVDEMQCDFRGIAHFHRLLDGADAPRVVELLAEADLVLLDVDHLGLVERRFFENARKANCKAVVVVDDKDGHELIKIWDNEIPERKFELTKYFHWSGTGIVDFTGQLEVTLNGAPVAPVGE